MLRYAKCSDLKNNEYNYNVNVFIYCIAYLLNRYIEIVWTVQELRLKLVSQVKIYNMCMVTVPEIKKKSKLNVVSQSKLLLNKRSKWLLF